MSSSLATVNFEHNFALLLSSAELNTSHPTPSTISPSFLHFTSSCSSSRFQITHRIRCFCYPKSSRNLQHSIITITMPPHPPQLKLSLLQLVCQESKAVMTPELRKHCADQLGLTEEATRSVSACSGLRLSEGCSALWQRLRVGRRLFPLSLSPSLRSTSIFSLFPRHSPPSLKWGGDTPYAFTTL